MFIVDRNEIQSLTAYLHRKGWLRHGDKIREASKPGEGNMNYVLRITSDNGSFIIKQSRGYVEKYPQILAPQTRVLLEGAFYKKVTKDREIKKYMPALIGMDAINNIIALEDLGQTHDYSHLYGMKTKLPASEILSLTNYLTRLHQTFYKPQPDDEFLNSEMRELNHQHIFMFPFLEDNGFNLDAIQEGLQETGMPYKTDVALKNKIEVAGKIYLSRGHYLLHGDYYPGSWLTSPDGIKVIDPEFCFYGPLEFDLGVMMAHLIMTRHDDALLNSVYTHYHSKEVVNKALLQQFIGIEIMRRLIGLAQLPLALDIAAKKELLQHARELILSN